MRSAGRVLPAFERFAKFFNDEYLPACLDGVGAWRLPDGEARYAYAARQFTTTKLTPQEIHDIGLREVARIRGEMEKAKERAGFLPPSLGRLLDPRTVCLLVLFRFNRN